MPQVRVREHQREDAARWEAFVDACPDATFLPLVEVKSLLSGRAS